MRYLPPVKKVASFRSPLRLRKTGREGSSEKLNSRLFTSERPKELALASVELLSGRLWQVHFQFQESD
jgi:hypothetical protein